MTEPNQAQPNRKPNTHGPDPHGHGTNDDRPPLSGRKAILLIIIVVVVAAVLVVTGIIPRLRAEKTLKARTGDLALANVTVDKPNVGEPSEEIVLPGNMFAYVDSPIYARTDGYLDKWYFDIGAHVKKGQLLATIASPEVDQELVQAKAQLATAEANVQRLEQLTGFEKVYAPFDGVVTARDVDTGTLINAGAGGTGGREMFHLDDEHVLRVYVNVPQVDAPSCTVGTGADLTVDQYPGRRFEGK